MGTEGGREGGRERERDGMSVSDIVLWGRWRERWRERDGEEVLVGQGGREREME